MAWSIARWAVGKMQRDKGKAFEQLIARKFRSAFPGMRIERSKQANDGIGASDVTHDWFHIECKHQKAPNIRAALEQAQRDNVHESKHPIAITRRDGEQILVTMTLESFLEVMGHLWFETGRSK